MIFILLRKSKRFLLVLISDFNFPKTETMKKLIILCCAAGILFSSCNKQLDLEPRQTISDEIVFTNDANIKKALTGAYDALSSAFLWGGETLLYSELQAANGEISWVGSYNQPREIFNKTILVNNSYVRDTWLDAYKTINICNNILAAIDIVNEDDRDRVRGEALFIRSVVYFDLVNFYAKPYSSGGATGAESGVPLVLTPTTGINEESYVSRNTIEEVYTQILEDLSTAETLLPEENDVFATNIAAAGFLSRVYLQMENYQEALIASNRAFDHDTEEQKFLHGSYSAAFNNTELTSEDIFIIAVNSQDGANDMHLFWSTGADGARDGDVEINQKHLDLYEAGDERLDLFYTGSGAVRSGKWRIRYRNLSIMRLAELYLTRAECNFRLGTADGATVLSDISAIRSRVGLTTTAGDIDLEFILNERKLELAHEGQAIQDVKRLKKTVDAFPYDNNKLVLPIPLREMNANPMLKQNPGYGG